ncbi:MAG TPA: hypothetical protein VH682_32800 [Gemmataceae bacterium]
MAKRKNQPLRAEQVIELLGRPECWSELDGMGLSSLVSFQSLALGVNADPALLRDMAPLYAAFAERCDEEIRGELEKIVVQSVCQGAGVNALLPFIILDPDLGVISTAALDYAVLCGPTEAEGPLTGPKIMLAFAEQESGLKDEYTRAGILMGLVLLGDRRLLPLLDGCWRWLGPEGRQALTRAISGNVTAGLIEFFLGWLEQTDDESDFGGIVGTLCRMPAYAEQIHDIERAFPVFSPDYPDGPIRVLKTWTFPQYYRRIKSRLKRIEERESEPKLIPEIGRYWLPD